MAKYKDDEIDVIKDDLEKLRTSPTLYISYKKKKGVTHLAKEATNNMLDECLKKYSPGNKVYIEIDENTKKFTIQDNGRGMQLDSVEDLCTYLQSGSNLHKEEGNRKEESRGAGNHGVGLTAINAFSKKVTIVSYYINTMEKGTFVFPP